MRVILETEHLCPGLVRLEGITVPGDYEPPAEPEEIGDIGPARAMYRAIRQDPTRNRPSSEALIRRIKRGLGLPRINALVDAVNVCSVRLGLPFGLYDTDRVRGDVVVGVGADGEGYQGVGDRHVNVGGRYRVRDDEGPFGNPTMDSLRTRITEETRNALVVVFAPAGYRHDRLGEVAETLRRVVGGSATTEVLSGT